MRFIAMFFSILFLAFQVSGQKVEKAENGKYVLRNAAGIQIATSVYDSIIVPSENCSCHKRLIRVRKDGFWGAIDTLGKVRIPLEYEKLRLSEGSLLPAKKDGRWGFLNYEGETVIPFDYEVTVGFFRGLAGVRKDNKWGFIDEKNNVIISYLYDDISNFVFVGKDEDNKDENARFAKVQIGKKEFFIDRSGEKVKTRKVERYLPVRGFISANLYDRN